MSSQRSFGPWLASAGPNGGPRALLWAWGDRWGGCRRRRGRRDNGLHVADFGALEVGGGDG